jgi:TRAP transporter TAXI family solute receptor
MISKKWIKLTWIPAVVLLPVLLGWIYQVVTAYPKEITIATGPPGGQYRALSQRLAKEIENKLKVKVNTVATDGSLKNLSLLRAGEADFGFYQTWTVEILNEFDAGYLREAEITPQDEAAARVEFVANVYSQPAHFIVRHDAGITSPVDLAGKTVSMGLKLSGDYAMSLVLTNHFGLSETAINAQHLNYEDLKQGFFDATLDAAFVTIGVNAPIFADLFDAGIADILSIPYSEALAAKHAPMYEYKIPAGRYRYRSQAAPASDIQTVAFGTQLLTQSDVHAGLVEGLTELVLSEDFLKSARLGELFGDRRFAQKNPEFPIHLGAQRVYYPELRPLLNVEFVEATEGMRSFVFSILIALYIGVRWASNRAQRRKEHKLERFIRRLKELEQRQISLGRQTDGGDIKDLHEALDELALLRQDALGSFSAHELNEDRATQCFIDMCDALSQRLNSKLSRQRLEQRLAKVTDAINNWNTQISAKDSVATRK